MTKYLIGAVLIILIGYGLVKATPLMLGPSIDISSPTDNATVTGGILNVTGKAERATTITLNGATLFHDQTGAFSSTLTFPAGGTILTFVATDRFGRTVSATRTIYVPATDKNSITNN